MYLILMSLLILSSATNFRVKTSVSAVIQKLMQVKRHGRRNRYRNFFQGILSSDIAFGFQFSLFSVSDCDYPQVTTGDQPAYYFWQRTVKKLRTHMVVDDG